jgi:hypothetical protein
MSNDSGVDQHLFDLVCGLLASNEYTRGNPQSIAGMRTNECGRLPKGYTTITSLASWQRRKMNAMR